MWFYFLGKNGETISGPYSFPINDIDSFFIPSGTMVVEMCENYKIEDKYRVNFYSIYIGKVLLGSGFKGFMRGYKIEKNISIPIDISARYCYYDDLWNGRNYHIIYAKLGDRDIVVSNADDCKTFLLDLSAKFIQHNQATTIGNLLRNKGRR